MGIQAAPKRPLRRRELIPEVGETDEMIWESGLVEKQITAATVFEKSRQYYRDIQVRRLRAPVLGYITPWNRQGFDLSVLFRSKLTHVSPVWYQIRRPQKEGSSEKEWVIVGQHEYNETWVNEVRAPAGEAHTMTKVVPRFIVELNDPEDHVSLLRDPSIPLRLILDEISSKDYDGMVLEVWTVWTLMRGLAADWFRDLAFTFIKRLHAKLHEGSRSRELILAVPPLVPTSYSGPRTEPEHIKQLAAFVDGWSVMTYDYAIGSGARPNSPLPWLETNMKMLPQGVEGQMQESHRVMMGLNFYGYDYALQGKHAPSAITSDAYMKLLATHQPVLQWEAELGEHYFDYTASDSKPHRVFYPSARSIQVRLEAFQQRDLGVSIWELGQGLERFFDLL